MHVTDQVLSIYAGTRGHLDKIPIKQVRDWERKFLAFMRERKSDVWQKLTDQRKLDDELRAAIDRAIAEFQAEYARETETVRV